MPSPIGNPIVVEIDEQTFPSDILQGSIPIWPLGFWGRGKGNGPVTYGSRAATGSKHPGSNDSNHPEMALAGNAHYYYDHLEMIYDHLDALNGGVYIQTQECADY